MSETTDKPKLGARAPLGLKRTVETGKVKQSFSHGRSNTVVVEVKRRRVLGPQGAPQEEQTPAPEPVAAAPAPQAPRPAAPAPRPPVSNETAQERQARLLREARAMARLTHPNVVNVLDGAQLPSGDGARHRHVLQRAPVQGSGRERDVAGLRVERRAAVADRRQAR